MKLVKKCDTLLCFEGDVKYEKPIIKQIEVDGVTYSNTTYEDIIVSVDEFRETHLFEKTEYDFELLEYKIEIEDYSYYSFSERRPCATYSNNKYVNLILLAFEEGLLDKRIKNVFTSGTKSFYYPITYSYDMECILNDLEVHIHLFSYGFNNSVYYTISLEDFFSSEHKKNEYLLKKMFSKYNINIDKGNDFKEIIKLILLKINNYETSK